jgi:hypothetical protein
VPNAAVGGVDAATGPWPNIGPPMVDTKMSTA